MAKMKVGFIGLGRMGRGMAKNLAKAGFEMTVFDVSKEPLKELQQLGAVIAASPGDVGRVSDVVITMVRDNAQTEQVILGEEGVLAGMEHGTIIVMSTISPSCIRAIAREAKEKKGIDVLDAPVSGAQVGAEKGTLSIMVGGDEGVFLQTRGVMEAMGKNIFYCGSIGAGLVIKLLNNMLLMVSITAVSEAIAIGLKEGLDADLQLSIYNASTGRSWPSERWNAVVEDWRHPANVEIARKDVKLALNLASENGLADPVIAHCSLPEL